MAHTTNHGAIKPKQLLLFMAMSSWQQRFCGHWRQLLSWAHRLEVKGRAAVLQIDGDVFASQPNGTACCKTQMLSKHEGMPLIYKVILWGSWITGLERNSRSHLAQPAVSIQNWCDGIISVCCLSRPFLMACTSGGSAPPATLCLTFYFLYAQEGFPKCLIGTAVAQYYLCCLPWTWKSDYSHSVCISLFHV